ncbi:MAG: vitamin K epoxide reductase family protein [Candidatus Magasanikbacteria bacterium]
MLQKIRGFFLRFVDIKKSLKIAIIIIGLIGLTDASYLTYTHFSNNKINCFTETQKVNSCQVVADSAYSTILGVPISLIGMCFYLVVIAIGAISFQKDFTFLLNLLLPFSIIAVLFSMRLIYLQVYIIGYICYYCLLSAALSCTLLGISWKIYNKISVPN